MRSDVKVVLNLKKPNGSKGFGFPLILDDSSKSMKLLMQNTVMFRS